MKASTTIYARVPESVYRFVKDEADRSGLPLAKVIEAFLTEAECRGWHVVGMRIEIADGQRDPATQPRDPAKAGGRK